MKRILAAALLALSLAACQTVQQPPDLAEIAGAICPPLQAAVGVLAVPGVPGVLDPAAEAEIAIAEPLIAAGQTVQLIDLRSLAASGLPALAKVAQAAPIDDSDRRAVIISLAVAQAAIASIGRGL